MFCMYTLYRKEHVGVKWNLHGAARGRAKPGEGKTAAWLVRVDTELGRRKTRPAMNLQ